MKIDAALAHGLSLAINRTRDAAVHDDPQSRHWTDRDLARRMTEAGHPMAHPAVIRARQGERTISVEEWLIFAHVLSVAPLSLLDPGQPVEIAGADHDPANVRDWVGGVRPLSSVESPAEFYATAGEGRAAAGASYFAGVLRGYADHFDTTTNLVERLQLLGQIARAALAQIDNDEHVKNYVEQRDGRAQKGGDHGESE